MAGVFLLSEAQRGAIGPLLPKNQPGARRTDDWRIISGIVHVLKTGCRWQDVQRLRTFDNDLQSLSPLDDARDLASVV
jgi:transposase